jgi:hypothetical protein
MLALIAIGSVYWMARRELGATRQMMSDASRLGVWTSTFSEVLAFSRKYPGGEATGTASHDQPCTQSDCFVIIIRNSDDTWERRPKLGYVADRILRRKWHYYVRMWVKDGRLADIRQDFKYMAPDRTSDILYHPVFLRTRISQPDAELCGGPFNRLHRFFAADPDGSVLQVWIDPSAAEERALPRVNIDCALYIPGCRNVAELAPELWREYESDRQFLDANENKRRLEATIDSECP